MGMSLMRASSYEQHERLVGINEDLSFYEGIGAGPNVTKVKEAVKKL
jgi:hypothetical protein